MNKKEIFLVISSLLYVTICTLNADISTQTKEDFKTAIQHGNLESIKKIVQANKDQGIAKIVLSGKFKNPFELTLNAAIPASQKLEIFKYLVQEGFDLDKIKQKLLQDAYAKTIIEIVDYLAIGLGKGKEAIIGDTIIKQALDNEILRHIIKLLKKGAYVQITDVGAQQFIKENKLQELNQLVDNKATISLRDGSITLFVSKNQLPDLLKLLQKGVKATIFDSVDLFIKKDLLQKLDNLIQNGAFVVITTQFALEMIKKDRVDYLKKFAETKKNVQFKGFRRPKKDEAWVESFQGSFFPLDKWNHEPIDYLVTAITYTNNIGFIKWLVENGKIDINQQVQTQGNCPAMPLREGVSSCPAKNTCTAPLETPLSIAKSLKKFAIAIYLKSKGAISKKTMKKFKCTGSVGEGFYWGSID